MKHYIYCILFNNQGIERRKSKKGKDNKENKNERKDKITTFFYAYLTILLKDSAQVGDIPMLLKASAKKGWLF